MLHLIVGSSMALIGIMGILTNLYIVVLLWNKKTRTSSEWILLHLSWCGIGGSLFHLCFLSPSILRQEFVLDSSVTPFCDVFSSIFGSTLLVLQLVSVWSVCALSADRAIAIVYPLRYSQIATSRRIAVYFVSVWLMSVATMMTALFLSSFHEPPKIIHHHHNNNDININGQNQHSNNIYNNNHDNNNKNVNMTKILSLNLNNPYSTNNNNNNNNNNYHHNSNNEILTGRDSEILSNSSPWIPHPNSNSNSKGYNDYNDTDTTDEGGGGRSGVLLASDSIAMSNPYASSRSLSDDNSSIRSSSSSSSSSSHSDSNNNNISSSGFYNLENVSADSVVVVGNGGGGGGDGTSNGNVSQVLTRMRQTQHELLFEFRPMLGICLPKVYDLTWSSCLWPSEWIFLILIAPMCTLLVCDLAVLSIARRQSHRILLAMTMVTITAQATVTRSKGMAHPTPPTALWANNVPARSRACRAVCEDLTTLFCLHLPLILILITETLTHDHFAPEFLVITGSLSLFATPSCNALLYGIRARPLRTAYKSYLRKRLTNTTLQNEIQNRSSSPVDGSPRPSSRAKSFRSTTPSPNSSPAQTPPRRLSTNDLRPPGTTQLILTSSPSHDHLGRSHRKHHGNHHSNRHAYDEESNNSTARKVRSFLHIPSFPSINQLDMTEFWSGLRRPNRSPTIVITHELGIKKELSNSILCSSPDVDAEQRL